MRRRRRRSSFRPRQPAGPRPRYRCRRSSSALTRWRWPNIAWLSLETSIRRREAGGLQAACAKIEGVGLVKSMIVFPVSLTPAWRVKSAVGFEPDVIAGDRHIADCVLGGRASGLDGVPAAEQEIAGDGHVRRDRPVRSVSRRSLLALAGESAFGVPSMKLSVMVVPVEPVTQIASACAPGEYPAPEK